MMGHRTISLAIRDRFCLEVCGLEFPGATEFWDRNWLVVVFSAKDQSGTTTIRGPYMHTTELSKWLNGVRDLRTGQADEFTFPSVEPMLDLTIRKSDELGHFEVSLMLRGETDHPRTSDYSRSTHAYEFGIDRTDLDLLEYELEAIVAAFPVLGTP